MPSPERPRKPVTVVHFPKQGKPRSSSASRPTQTLTETRAIDEVTDPYVQITSDDPAARRPTPQALRAVGEKPAEKHKKGRRTKTVETPAAEVPASAQATTERAGNEVADLAMFGHQLFEMGRIEDARVIFEGLVNTDPTDGFAHTMLGTIYLAMNAQERALALFQMALKLDERDLAALVYRGEIRLNRGKARAALEDLDRAITLGASDDPFVERARRLVRMAKALLGKKKR